MSLRFLIATIFFDLLFILPQKVNSQNQPPKKYQSLLWEITGNGLKKPSYLFGTMHVSNKMVFHLADSFYYALQDVNTVAIELNPEVWQVEMAKLDQLQKNYKSFAQGSINDYLNEASFKLNDYEDELKLALQSEPTIVNGLLYRTYKTKEDFEEDTFLDLYIYQTAKKLGKITTGVEDYFSTEKTVLEAYADMASEKKKNYDSGNESPYETEKKVEDAYRRGDLDLLDSLEKILLGPETFRDKFLIKRNEIQANSIDTILKKNTLFAGVGAAHLPGEKGVIELLRQKGYHLRPVKLIYKNTFRQNEIDKKKVPVKFYSQAPADSLFSVDVPGKMYKMSTDYSGLDRSQFADMSNGTYYLITRVESYNSFSSNSEKDVYEKIDSMLYENIPGRIIRKTAIIRNGYNGFDITNKTRRGDIQRYQIFVTPFEILIFKVSGKEMYVNGPEAERYFTSIQLKTPVNESNLFEPKQGGFQIKLPQTPHEYVNGSGTDGMDRLEYSAIDKTTGNSFFIFKKTVTNFGFLDEDTFDLNLAYESFKSSPFIKSDGGKTFGIFKNHPSLDASFTLKDGSYSKLKILLDGPHYYLLAARGKDSTGDFSGFFSSFNFLPFKYDAPKAITDTFLHFKVITPVVPELEENFRALIENISAKSYKISGNENEAYWPKAKNAFFQNEPTGEIIAVSMQQLPQYFQIKDNLNFAEEEKKDYLMNNDMVLSQFDSSIIDNQTSVWRFTITDTGSSRSIQRMLLYNNGRLYRIATMGDTSKNQTGFIKTFFSSFRPQRTDSSMFDINESKTDQFFKDLQSTDSATHTKALSAFSSIHFSKNDIPKLSNLIRNVKFKDKDYFEIKVKAIKELGYIKGEGTEEPVVKLLREVYESTGDTSTFENAVVKSLARNETKSSYKFLKELLMRDPPLFENSYDYSTFFSDINDSLLLARTLYPDILHLLTIDDYKDEITSTLAMLVDSNLISAKDYRNFYTNLYFDAKIALKKQRSKDEKLMKKEIRTDNDDDDDNSYSETNTKLNEFAKLLIPFYEKEIQVRNFFERLLYSKDEDIQMSTAILLLRNNKKVADSIINNLACRDKYRSALYESLQGINMENRFPSGQNTEQLMARSELVNAGEYNKIDSIEFVKKIPAAYKNQKGFVYFYKYRVNKDDTWKMAFSGLQPRKLNGAEASSYYTRFTDKKINYETTVEAQFEKEFKKMEISSHKSGRNFYGDDGQNRYEE